MSAKYNCKSTNKSSNSTNQSTNKSSNSTNQSTNLIITKVENKGSSPLEVFVKSLGVQTKAEIFLCNNTAYINIELVLLILSVELSWFIKNASSPEHYIKMNNNSIYINKYGMTKLLGQSKEQVAYRLQDYIYELLYLVETKGKVSIDDVQSRHDLIDSYHETLKEYKEVNDTLRCDYALTDAENSKLKTEISKLTDENEDLQDELKHITNIANKLAKYVKLKVVNPPSEVESLDIEEYDDEIDIKQVREILSDAVQAEKLLKSGKSSKKPKRPIKSKIGKVGVCQNYVLLRSINSYDGEYTWQISIDNLDDDFKKKSAEYMLDEDINILGNSNIQGMIWYADALLSDEKKSAVLLFLSLRETYPESVICRLIQ
jgi:hypothetical protein